MVNFQQDRIRVSPPTTAVEARRAATVFVNHDVDQYMGGSSSSWGYPNSWMVFVRENPNLKWMRTGGTPMTQETTT